MVGEFPELQGTMGAYHAAADGEHAEVIAAIREHYQPRGAGDALPTTATGTTLALADRLDTLAGIFGIGQKPSGTKDPFALRRAAIGVLRILLEQRRDLDVGVLVDAAVALQPVKTATTAAEVREFILERLRAHALEAGHPAEAFDAALASGSTRPLDLMARLEALAAFRRLPEAEVLAAANNASPISCVNRILVAFHLGSTPSCCAKRLNASCTPHSTRSHLRSLQPCRRRATMTRSRSWRVCDRRWMRSSPK